MQLSFLAPTTLPDADITYTTSDRKGNMTTQTTPKRIEGPTFPERVSLKGIKIHHGLSEETWAYTASVYVDGKRVGEVSNSGHGGPDNLHVADKAKREVVEAAQQQHSPGQYGEDVLFGDMLNEHLLMQDVKKMQRKGYAVVLVMDGGRSLAGIRSAEGIDAALAEYKPAEYRVVGA